MGIWAKLTGASDVIKSGFELIDNMHTSEEEGIAARAKAKTDLLNSYAPFKVAQRVIAWAFTFTFLFCFVLCLGTFMYAFFFAPTVGAWVELADGTREIVQQPLDPQAFIDGVVALMAAFNIHWIMTTIAVFYFGGGFAEGAINARNGKK